MNKTMQLRTNVCVRSVSQSCPNLCNPLDCSLPGSSVHGIFQARVLDWDAIAFSEEIPGVTRKFRLGVPNEAWQRLIEFCQEKALVIANNLFQQHKTLHMDITRWSTLKSDWLYSWQPKVEKLCTVSKNKTRSWLWLRWWTPYWQIQA